MKFKEKMSILGGDTKQYAKRHKLTSIIIALMLMSSCSSDSTETTQELENKEQEIVLLEDKYDVLKDKYDFLEDKYNDLLNKEEKEEEEKEEEKQALFDGYKLIEVDGGDLSGDREANVVVDIGYGDREYWAFTNEHGQLVKVIAKEIILQDDEEEQVNSDGRYYDDEAKVPGVESGDLDEGHIIADSLGGVSNAYNITPQNSTLNRDGDQAYMENVIRNAGGCTDFEAIITYENTETQIPSHYSFTYTINGNVVKDEFDNVDPNAETEEETEVEEVETVEEKEDVVYWVSNGKKYHSSENCRSLSKSKNIRSGSIEESGREGCGICTY